MYYWPNAIVGLPELHRRYQPADIHERLDALLPENVSFLKCF